MVRERKMRETSSPRSIRSAQSTIPGQRQVVGQCSVFGWSYCLPRKQSEDYSYFMFLKLSENVLTCFRCNERCKADSKIFQNSTAQTESYPSQTSGRGEGACCNTVALLSTWAMNLGMCTAATYESSLLHVS